MIRKQYPYVQGCGGAGVPHRAFVQQETDHLEYLSAFGHRKKRIYKPTLMRVAIGKRLLIVKLLYLVLD